jgi:uncharacterized membrane protein (DUF485 family)
MADTTRTPEAGVGAEATRDRVAGVDWEGIERSREFQELVAKRRSFVLPATIFFLAYYMAFILLAGYAKDFMASSVYEGLTVGYTLALTQFVMVFVLGVMYLRRADRDYDPLAQRVVDAAGREPTGRFQRSGDGEREAAR